LIIKLADAPPILTAMAAHGQFAYKKMQGAKKLAGANSTG
jgi:hypothetical protein